MECIDILHSEHLISFDYPGKFRIRILWSDLDPVLERALIRFLGIVRSLI